MQLERWVGMNNQEIMDLIQIDICIIKKLRVKPKLFKTLRTEGEKAKNGH